ncbi:sensor histidine kinase [Kitasatospora sp. NPDC054939]
MRQWARDPGHLLTAAALFAAGLSLAHLWWAAPTAVAALLAGRRPGRTGPTVLVLVAVVAAGVIAVSVVPGWLPLGGRFVAVLVLAVLLPWFAGRFWRQSRELARAGWERAEQLQREHELIADRARLRERARIAQDMHDVLGHDLSLIALSAGALKLAPGLAEEHRRAAGDLRARAAASVERLGEVVGVLREGADDRPATTGPHTLAGLVAEASAAGLAVELSVDGPVADLPTVVEPAVHRVVQEALTNVAKHAPAAVASVRVVHGDGETAVVVENGPPAPGRSGGGSSAPGPVVSGPVVNGLAGSGPAGSGSAVNGQASYGGYGLIGLAERVRLAGGSFTYGPRGAGFAVSARLPHAAPVRPAPVPPSPAASPVGPGRPQQEYRRARRRTRRALALAVAVPLVTGALLSAALTGRQMLSASGSVLDAGDFARLRVGQDRAEVVRHLPAHQTGHRPLAAEPGGPDVSCEYYAVTADRFDDRSGDAYRLCFRAGRLISLDVLTP